MPTVQVYAAFLVNIRNQPSTDGTIISTLISGDTTTADGRSEDSRWLRIHIPDSDAFGWASVGVVSITGRVSSLNVVDTIDVPKQFKPMQAFYFQSGVTPPGCDQAPQDGILVQAPRGAGAINLRADDVDIQLQSTAYLQAQPGGSLTVSVIQGDGQVTSEGTTVDVPAGAQVTVPLDADLHAAGAPSEAQAYDPALVAPLPIQLLPESITIAPPASAQVLAPPTPTPHGAATGYLVFKVMNLSDESLDGLLCTVDQPFDITMRMTTATTILHFTPTGAGGGTWAYQYDLALSNEHHDGSGIYRLSDAATDGSRIITMDGSEVVQTTRHSTTHAFHYVIGLSLTPASACSG